jgi:hypothetical protein
MNFQEWVEKYKPLKSKDEIPYAFGTYGGDDEFVQKCKTRHIWTLLGGGDWLT